jgi:hypothetical protein
MACFILPVWFLLKNYSYLQDFLNFCQAFLKLIQYNQVCFFFCQIFQVSLEAVLKMFCARPPAVAPSLLFCRPEPPFFCRPEHPFFVATSHLFLSPRAPFFVDIPKHRLERSEEGHRPERSEGCLAIARQDRVGVSPRALFFCRHEASAEGSLGAYAPRNDIPGRCPERCEGCLAIARQDKVGGLF